MSEQYVPACQSLLDDGTRCPEIATHIVKGRPGYRWYGVHCEPHARITATHYDHQGGCVVARIEWSGFMTQDVVRDESHMWPNVQCWKTEPHQAHRFVGGCGLPEWCPGLICDCPCHNVILPHLIRCPRCEPK